MANIALSTLVGGAGLSGVQTGHINNVTPSTSTGEDAYYYDVTITAVGDTTKCISMFDGGAGTNANDGMLKSGSTASALVTARLTSTTNLRVSFQSTIGTYNITGRWTVIEFS